MPAVSPGPSEPAADADAGDRVRQLRPSSTPGAQAFDGASGGPELSGVALARRRESAARNATAAEHFAAGRFDEAIALFEQSLASCRSTLGSDHPETLVVAGNLGVAYVASGNRRKGIKMITGNVATRARVLGDDHPDTLTARDALAAAHRVAGDADTAVALAKEVVLQRSRTLGPVHVDTLNSRMGLALALASAGDMNSAHRILGSTMSDAEQAFGPDDDHVLALIECGESNGLLRRET
jgi:tetratricopeptide (TPR) repeat protein